VVGGPWDEPSGEEADIGENEEGEEGGVNALLKEEDALAYTHDRLTPMVLEQRRKSWRENRELRDLERIQEDKDIYRMWRGST
jgi:hypothetical protein